VIDTHVDGDVEAIRGNADWLRTTLRSSLSDGGDETQAARRQSDRSWEGEDQRAYHDFTGRLVRVTDQHESRVGRAATAIDDYAGRLRRLQHRMEQLRDNARSGGLIVAGETIERPDDAPAVPALPAGASPEQADAHAEQMAAHDRAVEKIELYDRISDDCDSAWQTFVSYIDVDLAAAVEDAREGDEVDALKTFVTSNGLNFVAGSSLIFFDKDLARRADDYRARAHELRRARRSGNPARRARGNAPGAQQQVRQWRNTARSLSRVSRVLGPVGVAVDIGFGIWDVSQGGSPGRATATTVASIAGGALVVAGAGALAAAGVVTAPVWGTALAAGAVAVGAGWVAGQAWDALPDGVTDTVDDAISDAWESTTDAVSSGWDKVTGWL